MEVAEHNSNQREAQEARPREDDIRDCFDGKNSVVETLCAACLEVHDR